MVASRSTAGTLNGRLENRTMRRVARLAGAYNQPSREPIAATSCSPVHALEFCSGANASYEAKTLRTSRNEPATTAIMLIT